jgi:hypothetical protein
MNEDPRAGLLRKMLAYELPIEPTIESLAALPYDCDDDLVFVTSKDILQIIDRHAGGDLSVEQLVEWADFLEVRDGVGFAPPHGDRLKEIVWQLANPLLNGAITPAMLRDLRLELVGLVT